MISYMYKKCLTGLFVISQFVSLAVLTSCEDKLDITPKGKVTLSSVDELELLLNQQ